MKEASENLLGAKSATISRKIDEIHAKYGDACWKHLDGLDRSSRLFYGELGAPNLTNEIAEFIEETRK